MGNARAVVRALHDAAEQLAKAAVWNGSRLEVDAHKDNYVFELLCYFTLGLAARSSYALRLEGTTTTRRGKRKARWPKSPGLKANFAYLRLTPSSRSAAGGFQLCPGIEIKDKYSKARAPDINLLRENTTKSPTYRDLLGCWDAKYSARPSAPLRDEAVADFIYTHQQLGSPVPPSEWTAAVKKREYLRSGVLTNAQCSSEPNGALASNNVTETSNFPQAPSTRP
jgi:hypothetical protein